MVETLARPSVWRTMVLAALLAALAVLASRFERREVEGSSMAPSLLPGDRLLMRKISGRAPGVGQIVLLEDPRDPERLLIKRIGSVEGDQLWVFGDNQAASSDSRVFGPVHRSSIRSVLVRRYGRAPVV